MLTVKAYAKINLSLEVLGKLESGYHRIVSVMQTINLSDEISYVLSNELTVQSNLPSLDTPDNLVLKAADILKQYTGYPGGVNIYLKKTIPAASGLGGGSSDAAATLRALCNLWDLETEDKELEDLASTIGSDVPFFLSGGTAIAEGRGEIIHKLPLMPTVYLVILTPDMEMPYKTANMYAHLTPKDYTAGEISFCLKSCLENGKQPDDKLFFNVFERVAFDLLPQLQIYRRAMLQAGASCVHLTGSGPALYTMESYKDKAIEMAERLRESGYKPYLTCTIDPS